MGARRMALTWLSMGLLAEHRYQPRHRSAGRIGNGVDEPGSFWLDNSSGSVSEPATGTSVTESLDVDDHHPAAPDSLDQMAFSAIRRILEGCVLDDPTTVVPDLVQLIAHSSHTPATL